MASHRLCPRLTKRKRRSVALNTLLSQFSQSGHVVPGTQRGHRPGAPCPSVPLWSLLPLWEHLSGLAGGCACLCPRSGQLSSQSFPPAASHLTRSEGVTCVSGFACSHGSPARVPPCRRAQGVGPAWSQSPGSRLFWMAHHCDHTALCPRGPSEASGGSVTAHLHEHPGVLASLQRVGVLRGHAGCACPSLGSWSCVFQVLRALSTLGAVCTLLRVG